MAWFASQKRKRMMWGHSRGSMLLLLSIQIVCLVVEAAPARDMVFPPMKLDFFNIKTPQLIGIIAGITVFAITISVVFYLLYASGSFTKLANELKDDIQNMKTKKVTKDNVSPQFANVPELYEHLLKAMTSLSERPTTDKLDIKNVSVRVLDLEKDANPLFQACNGSAQYHESQYPPLRIWGWFDFYLNSNENNKIDASLQNFKQFYSKPLNNGQHFVIIDKEYNKPIGMFSLLDNNVNNLSVRLDYIWITPAFQTKKRVHEAMLLIINWLFNVGYRRITAELDERHIIGRKFIERVGFQLEAILRKHKIVQNRNRNTALYVILNSEWLEIGLKLQKYLGLELHKKTKKAIEIDSIELLQRININRIESNDDADKRNNNSSSNNNNSGSNNNNNFINSNNDNKSNNNNNSSKNVTPSNSNTNSPNNKKKQQKFNNKK